MSREDEGFLTRWSRRKQEAEKTEPPAAADGDIKLVEGALEQTGEAGPTQKPEEAFDLSKLPAIESLGKDSDYSMFMHKAVPDDLRLKALRRMWASDPMLAAPDLLDMHQLDYTGNDGVRPLVHPALEALAAAAKELAERARKAASEKEAPADSPGGESAETGPAPDPDKQSSG